MSRWVGLRSTLIESISDLARLEVDIQQFGAVADADPVAFTGTENTAAINAAITYANSLPSGANVIIPPGYFLIGISTGSNGIIMKSNVRLIGKGGWLLLKNSTVAHMVCATSISHFSIEGLKIDGNKANQASANIHGIRVTSCTDYDVCNNEVYRTAAYGITNNIVQRGRVTYNRVYDSGADGIDFHNDNLDNVGSLVSNNIVDGYGDEATTKAGIHGRGRGLSITSNVVMNAGAGASGLYGILAGNGETVYGQHILNNYVELGGDCTNGLGIGANNPNSIVSGNTVVCTADTLDGIIAAATAAGSTLTGNIVVGGPSRDGICVRSGADNCTLTANKVSDAGGDGYQIDATGTQLLGNSAKTCGEVAFDCASSTNTYLDEGNRDITCTGGFISRGTNTTLAREPNTTWANKPTSIATGRELFITDAGTTGSFWTYNSRWRPKNGIALLATLDAISSNIAAAETIVFQYLIPAGLLQAGDRLRLRFSAGKSGTTDSGTVRFRIGTAGTTSDTSLYSGTPLIATTNRSASIITDWRLESATSLRQLGNSASSGAALGYSNVAAGAAAAAVTISNVSNALYFSVSLLSSGAADTVNLIDAQLELVSPAN